MSSSADLFVVCRTCGSEVSTYVTECPYCGNRMRKRAPKLARPGEPERRRRAPRMRHRGRPRLGRLRPGEMPGIRYDLRALGDDRAGGRQRGGGRGLAGGRGAAVGPGRAGPAGSGVVAPADLAVRLRQPGLPVLRAGDDRPVRLAAGAPPRALGPAGRVRAGRRRGDGGDGGRGARGRGAGRQRGGTGNGRRLGGPRPARAPPGAARPTPTCSAWP